MFTVTGRICPLGLLKADIMTCRSISGKSILASMQFFPNYLITMTAHITSKRKTRSSTHKPCAEGEFGWRPASSITLGHRAYHRWARWSDRRGTRSLSVHDFYSYLLRLLRAKTQTWSKRTSIKHLFLVMITSLRCWNTLNNKISKECVQRERRRQRGTHFFLKKILKKIKKITRQKKKCPVNRAQGWGDLLPC